MEKCVLLFLACTVLSSSAWSIPYYPAPRAPVRVVRYAPHPHHLPPQHRSPGHPMHEPIRLAHEPIRVAHEPIRVAHQPIRVANEPIRLAHEPSRAVHEHEEHGPPQWQRPKRGHDHDYDGDHRSSGVTGPVHTFVKTDKNANYKWGVRHHVGDKFSS